MESKDSPLLHLLYVLAAAVAVFLFAHWDGLVNEYVIKDDVRQQVFWMQQWQDPELYQDDLLARHASNYVPRGVKAVYYAGSLVMNPVQFSKVVAGFLFVISAGFLFGLGKQFRDELTAVMIVCVFFFFGGFMRKISGGLSQGFAFPLLIAYLFFLARKSLGWASVVILIQSFLNPYIFMLCAVTQTIYLSHNYGRSLLDLMRGRGFQTHANHAPAASLGRLVFLHVPVLLGVLVMAIEYLLFKSADMGDLVTAADMAGKIEYTAAGRFEFMPMPSVFYEFVRPWMFNLPFKEWGLWPSWFLAAVGLAVVAFAITRRNTGIDLWGFRVFFHLSAASLLLYIAAHVFFFKLFLPRRYAEFPLQVFYCVGVGVCLRVALGAVISNRVLFPLVATLLVVLAALRLYHVALYDYSQHSHLCRFLEDVAPKTALIAGPPDVMDNVITFARRKAFVTYELSHTWYKGYWSVIKKRTYDFFSAYYSADPTAIRKFCEENAIDYLVVRVSDFHPERIKSGIHFEPFDSYIREIADSRSHFAVLDPKAFPPVYRRDDLVVIKPK